MKGPEGIEYEARLSRRARRLRLSLSGDGRLVLTRPFFVSQKTAEDFLCQQIAWIRRQQEKLASQERLPRAGNRKEYLAAKEKARVLVSGRLEYFNRWYGFSWQTVSIRDQKTRWGSCSRRGNLNFNYRLLYLPPADQDYVIVHELCHRGEMNHSPRFWRLVSRTIPDYQVRRRRLRRLAV